MIADKYIGPYVKELHHPNQGYILPCTCKVGTGAVFGQLRQDCLKASWTVKLRKGRHNARANNYANYRRSQTKNIS